ncbi:Ribonuclease H-like superfamily [Sesbania bispinosa]|nr:Ribonuclease H-like superfamily [Sesbania bispinosa]
MASSRSGPITTLHLLRVGPKKRVTARADQSQSTGGRSSGEFVVPPSAPGAWKSWKQRPTYSENVLRPKQHGATLPWETKFPLLLPTPLIFEQKDVPLPLLYTKAVDACLAIENRTPPPAANRVSPQVRPKCWIPPPSGFFKINVDAALRSGNSWGCGIIVRDSEGIVLAAASQSFTPFPDASVAEAMAARLGLKFAMDTNFDSIILESNYKVVTDLFISNSTNQSYLGMIVQDCISIALLLVTLLSLTRLGKAICVPIT